MDSDTGYLIDELLSLADSFRKDGATTNADLLARAAAKIDEAFNIDNGPTITCVCGRVFSYKSGGRCQIENCYQGDLLIEKLGKGE
jgi:hypothetical protein